VYAPAEYHSLSPKEGNVNILFIHEVDWINKVVFDIHSLAEALSLSGHRIFAIDYEAYIEALPGSKNAPANQGFKARKRPL